MADLAATARTAYRALVWDDPAFPAFFAAATPIAEIASLRLGSRPASRPGRARASGAGGSPTLAQPVASLRAIPWVFAWSQTRLEVPGWFGFGSAVASYRSAGSGRLGVLRRLYRDWPMFRSLVDNAELSAARVDLVIGRRYASLAPQPDGRRIYDTIAAEHARTVEALRAITGHPLLAGQPVLRAAIDRRNPDVDVLSAIQIGALRSLRSLPEGDERRQRLTNVVRLTLNAIAAGLQTTG
jgi:phosphoenolpyruvate carboxylase